jgi:hypothetical protein
MIGILLDNRLEKTEESGHNLTQYGTPNFLGVIEESP